MLFSEKQEEQNDRFINFYRVRSFFSGCLRSYAIIVYFLAF